MKKVLAIVFAALMLLGLAACSNGSGGGAGGSETPNVDRIKAAGKLVMMTNATFPPFEYVKGGEVQGVDPELAKLIAAELGVELEIIDMDFDLLTAAVQSGKGDLVAAGMSITPERQEQVDFSNPYVDTTLMIIVPVGSSIAGPDDLAGLTIAVQEATTSDLFVQDYVENATVLAFKDAVAAGDAVKNGKADAAVIDEMTAKNVVDANTDSLTLLEEPLGTEQYAMAVKKDSPDLLAVVNQVLDAQVAEDNVNKLVAEHMELSK